MGEATAIRIDIQHADFVVGEEYTHLRASAGDAGAVVFFSGCVRADSESDPVTALELEYYPGMTEKSLQQIARQAAERWPLAGVRVIHRVGRLALGEQIVFVGVAARHRSAAFAAAEYLMDFLKTEAPFWKKEHRASGEVWVEARHSDREAVSRW